MRAKFSARIHRNSGKKATLNTSEYAFDAKLCEQDENHYSVDSTRIIDRRTKIILQLIADINRMPRWFDPKEAVQLVDANHDGHPDIMFPYADGAPDQTIQTIFTFIIQNQEILILKKNFPR